ncbi:MAG TPA: TAXI family TRAP transporter solute-binding subunit [Azospirillaceae bacterium]|nr:TAXI family TRAP transporter solute-binding subunit [Azospirillaceae bacterium]
MFAAVLLAALPPRPAVASDTLLRIGSGGVGGTYHPIAVLLARGLSGIDCPSSADCGIPNVLAVAQASNGSVANVEALAGKRIELGIAQGNVAHHAFNGTGPFAGRPANDLRAIGALYIEALHVVARRDSGISRFEDLRGRRVSLDEPGSGTLDDARLALGVHGMAEGDVSAEYMKPDLALARMRDNRLDVFFIMAGAPVPAIASAADEVPLTLVPIAGRAADALVAHSPYYAKTTIPASAYQLDADAPTVGTGALLLVRADLPDALVEAVTRMLWSERMLALLVEGHPKGREVRPERALDGVSIPLHAGAERYYREIGRWR